MAAAPDVTSDSRANRMMARETTSLLRFITCGSVDDGKSTLIGRLLYDSKLIFSDQLAALEADSKRFGTQGDDVDLALLVDGLAAEREQGITIDVAYRYFATSKRKFIVADTPGHEQYTRNMITGASTADAAVILVDARNGVLTQTRRHSYLVSLVGIRHVVLAVNKMDLVDFSQEAFDKIVADYRTFASQIGIEAFTALPISALDGDNVFRSSSRMPWYDGPSLLSHLEAIELGDRESEQEFRFWVQWVNRPNADFRGFCGTLAGGVVRRGDTIRVWPGGKSSKIERIVTADGDLEAAVANQSVTLTLVDEIDVSRGDLLSAADAAPGVSDQFEVTLVWMSESAMLPGRSYWLKMGTRTVGATVTELKYAVNVNTLEHLAAKTLELNGIAFCNISVSQPVPFDPYTANKETGGFILIDRMTNATVGAGMIRFALRRSQHLRWQAIDVDRHARAALKHQKPCILWFTGLSGAGKSTIANLVEKRLHVAGKHTYMLDGDNVRHGLNRDLGFTDADRVENIRRVGEVAKLMMDAGLIVMASFISPFRAERNMVRELVGAGEFLEIYVEAPLALVEKRDPKGLYRRARRGEIRNFTGIDSTYEPPVSPDVFIETANVSAEDAASLVVNELVARGVVAAV